VYKVDRAESNEQIVYPEQPLKEPLAVTEIGQAHHSAGFASEITRQNNHVLLCVISGKCTYNASYVNAPALIYVSPNSPVRYKVDESCRELHVCHIKFDGEIAEDLLSRLELDRANEIIPLKHPEKVLDVFSELTAEANYTDVDDSLFMLSGLYKLLAIFTVSVPQKEVKNISSYTQTVLDYIHENYRSHISEKDMAALTNLSTNYMHKIFLSDMNTTPINYLNFYRIDRAKELLRNTDHPIANIADAVGISGGDYFCRVFRKYNCGISPTRFRKRTKMKIIENN
jgi:AraC-like DNA-binding protein